VSKAEFLARVRAARTELELVLASQDERTLAETTLPGQSWTSKDLLAHLSSTQAALPAVARSRGNEGATAAEKFDSDRWNASQVRRRKDLPPEDLIAELRAAAVELDGVLAELPLDELIGSGPYAGETAASALGSMIDHQRDHLAELRRSLAASPG